MNYSPTKIQLRPLALLIAVLLSFADRGSSQDFPPFDDSIAGVPSTDNFLLYEQIINISESPPFESEPLLRIQSDVPLTIHRYLSDDNWLGGEPLDEGTALVLVSSSCDTSDTTLIPLVEMVKAGNDTILSIKVGVPETEAADMPFLKSSSYDAVWYEAGCPMPTFPSTTAATVAESSTAAPTMVSTDLGEGKFGAPCASQSACDERRQQLGISRFKVGDFPSKGCFSKNGIAYFGTGGTAEEESQDVLPGIRERIWCEWDPDASSSSSGPTPTASITVIPTMISTEDAGSMSNLPTIVTTELGEGKMFVPCASDKACDERRQELGITRFEVGEFPSKGCFSKNGIAFFGTGGSAEEELRDDLPGEQERIWCDADFPEEDAQTRQGNPCETGPSANTTKSCGTGQFCELGVGVCNTKLAVFEGVCAVIPQVCPLNYMPVCGCDGETYGNACAARGAGVSVSFDGECTIDEGNVELSNVTACETGPSADPDKSCSSGQFCELDTGECNAKSAVFDGVCTNIPEACTLEYNPVCGCDGETYGNACAAQGAGVSISREGECTSDSTDGGTTAVEISCMTKIDCDMARQQKGFAKFNVGVYPTKGCFSKNGIAFFGTGGTVAQKSRAELPGIQERIYCGEDVIKADSACQTQAECNQKRLQLGITAFQAGDFPTKGCFVKPGVAFWGSGGTSEEIATYDLPGLRERIWCDDSKCETGPSADPAKSCGSENLFCKLDSGVCNAKLAVFDGMCAVKPVSCQEIYAPVCGCDGVTYGNACDAQSQGVNISFNGKCPEGRTNDLLRQQALESQVDYKSSSSSASITTVTIGSVIHSSLASHTKSNTPPRSRNLQACSYNVEVFVSGCNYFGPPAKITVAAPKARVIDSVMENVVKEKIDSPALQNTTQFYAEEYKYTATFTFPDNQAKLVEISDGSFTSVPSATEDQCIRIICGRPFIDFDGNNLLAKSISSDVCDGTSSWLGDTSMYIGGDQLTSTQITNDIANQHRLGEEWTRNALGEHASVASFAAFSIALMTNQAPSDLVEDSLKAALDEVRHAKMSFSIASLLEGTDVIPGPLPPSNHQFGHDMTALTLSVAREGCVDETLSALAAAAEVEMIDKVLDLGAAKGTKYHGIERDLLIRIRNDLRTISIDESNHSALAWRTLDWACMVDVDACDAVKQNVLNEQNLLKAFHRRFGRDFTAPAELSDRMLAAWKSIYSSQKILVSFNVTKDIWMSTPSVRWSMRTPPSELSTNGDVCSFEMGIGIVIRQSERHHAHRDASASNNAMSTMASDGSSWAPTGTPSPVEILYRVAEINTGGYVAG